MVYWDDWEDLKGDFIILKEDIEAILSWIKKSIRRLVSVCRKVL